MTRSTTASAEDLARTKPAAPHKARPASKEAKDAINLLKADHEAVRHLFSEYEMTHSVTNKKALVAEICTALSVHAQIEEEIFYPAVKTALKDKRSASEAAVGHAGVKGLIAQLKGVEPDGAPYDAKVRALSEYVKRHIKEEQSEMFLQARASSLDMVDLGARMAARKEDLLARAA